MSMTAEYAQNDLLVRTRCLLRNVQRGAAAWSAALLGTQASTRGGWQFGILMYHRIIDRVPGQPTPTWNVTPARLRQQLSGLLQRGYQAWPLRKVLEYRQRRMTLPPKVFVVTFDDGYENNFTQALPILSDLKVPATIFLATAYLGTNKPFPFDDWKASGSADVPADAWRPLSIEQCRQLQASQLVELAAHTHTHQDFRGRLDALRDDVRNCAAFLQENFGLTDATFAFPYGTKRLGFAGETLARVVRESGLLCSLTTEWELARLDGDPFDWGRFQVDQRDSAAILAGKLSGWYGWLRSGARQLSSLLLPKSQSAGARQRSLSAAPLRFGRFR